MQAGPFVHDLVLLLAPFPQVRTSAPRTPWLPFWKRQNPANIIYWTVRNLFNNRPKQTDLLQLIIPLSILENLGTIRKSYNKISDGDQRLIIYSWFHDNFLMAPAQGLKWHSWISDDDPKHPVLLEQILDLRRFPLPQVTEQRCQDCQTDHRGVTEINMAEFIRVAWSGSCNTKKYSSIHDCSK